MEILRHFVLASAAGAGVGSGISFQGRIAHVTREHEGKWHKGCYTYEDATRLLCVGNGWRSGGREQFREDNESIDRRRRERWMKRSKKKKKPGWDLGSSNARERR